MPVLNHHIVGARDAAETARFWVEVLGYDPPGRFHQFATVEVSPDTVFLFATTGGEARPGHYAFLVGDEEFDAILARVEERGLTHWSDPSRSNTGQINHREGGRGVYFEDPDGHLLELMTKPHQIEPAS